MSTSTGTRRRRVVGVAAVAVGAVLAVVAGLAVVGGSTEPTAAAVSTTASAGTPADALSRSIATAQAALQRKPDDAVAWATLGAEYVEQARITADPSYYPKSQEALERSLSITPDGNDRALTGQGALANARHEFSAAADHARAALAVNAYSATAHGVLADALTQLGDYDGATAAVQQMLDLKPGVASFTRASYDLELHGNTGAARKVLQQALAAATDPRDEAYCRTYLGELDFSTGDLDGAEREYEAGLALTPDEPGLLLGRARVQAARGDTEAAVAGYQHVVDLRPLPGTLVEYGQLLESLGRDEAAAVQYSLFDASAQLFAANGVQDSLTGALLAADDGDGASAVPQAVAEHTTRQNIDSADALGWALHAAGRDAEALAYAQEATRLGTRNASFLYHRGIIEAATGATATARATLTEALDTNPHFSPLSVPRLRSTLAELGGPT